MLLVWETEHPHILVHRSNIIYPSIALRYRGVVFFAFKSEADEDKASLRRISISSVANIFMNKLVKGDGGSLFA